MDLFQPRTSTPDAGHSRAGHLVTHPDISLALPAVQEFVPLPQFSMRILTQLSQGNILPDFDHFIEECAYQVISCGDMKDKAQYFDFGRRMFNAYPCIEFHSGQHPWVYYFI